MALTPTDQAALDTLLLATPGPRDGRETYESGHMEAMAEFLTNSYNDLLDTLDQMAMVASDLERARLADIKEQVNHMLEEIKKQKQLSGLQKFFKALGFIGLILSALAMVVAPSPVTISVFVVSMVMILEPIIAKAAGNDSLIEKGLGGLFKELTEHLGTIGGAVVGSLIMIVLLVVVNAGLATLLSAAGSASSGTMRALGNMLDKLIPGLKSSVTGFSPRTQTIIRRVIELVEAGISAGQGGIQIKMAEVQKLLAELKKLGELSQAGIDYLSSVIDAIGGDFSKYQDAVIRTLKITDSMLAPLNPGAKNL